MAALGTAVINTKSSPTPVMLQKVFKIFIGRGFNIKPIVFGKKVVSFFWK